MNKNTKTIKGIDEKTWAAFKVIAAKKRLPMGRLFSSMVKSYEKNVDNTWDAILHSGKLLSNKEAEELHEITRKIRKEKWVRNASRS